MSRLVNTEGLNDYLLSLSQSNKSLGRLEMYDMAADKYDCSSDLIRKRVPQEVKNKLFDKRGKEQVTDHQAIINAYIGRAYKHQKEIAIQLGCSENVVSRVIMKYRLQKAENALIAKQKRDILKQAVYINKGRR